MDFILIVIAIVCYILVGFFFSIGFDKLEFPDKRIMSLIIAVTLGVIGGLCLCQFEENCRNDAIIHYQNGDYYVVDKPNGDVVYKIIPTDYD